ncbi:8-oxo-dGTP diphosphatase [Friedmanniella luteola]|uniref:8-oxo-dGTP diphosphatase n=1 Tax=Friedmanniella luteola TaxID=546871 RepID=A0A1H1L6E0_9ACTN|nr:(deoxy)nucleoside triphosphate pyrophosphohydrolase [Friedmanniella luteola]SDR70043.1 8-oxo-dGTP diphosphatase [Friedmanniella luteola]
MELPRLVVGAILVDRLDRPSRVLAARRTAPPALAGRWELPGGKVEPGERPEDALHRELAEELGVEVRLGAELLPDDGGTWPLTPGLVLRAWWCELTTGEPQAGVAHDALCWTTAADVADLAWLDPDRPLVARIAAALAARRTAAEGRLGP